MNDNFIDNPIQPSLTLKTHTFNPLATAGVLLGIVAIIVTLISWIMLNEKITHSEMATRLLIDNLQTQTLAEFNHDHALIQALTPSKTIAPANPTHLNAVIAQVQLANDALNNENNIPFAISFLTAAEAQLKTAQLPNDQTALELLSQTLTSLKNLPMLDTSALYLKISQLISTIDTLPLGTAPTHTMQKKTDTENVTSDKTWREHLADSWDSLKKLVNVRHDDEVLTPALLNEEDRAFINARAVALLTQTQLALLQRQDTIYHNSLKTMMAWLSRYFASDDPRVKTMNADLISLNQENLLPTLPSLTPLINALLNLQKNKTALA